jgi:hypothetical protein
MSLPVESVVLVGVITVIGVGCMCYSCWAMRNEVRVNELANRVGSEQRSRPNSPRQDGGAVMGHPVEINGTVTGHPAQLNGMGGGAVMGHRVEIDGTVTGHPAQPNGMDSGSVADRPMRFTERWTAGAASRVP